MSSCAENVRIEAGYWIRAESMPGCTPDDRLTDALSRLASSVKYHDVEFGSSNVLKLLPAVVLEVAERRSAKPE